MNQYAVGATVQIIIRTRERLEDTTDGDYLDMQGSSVTVYDPSGVVVAASATTSYKALGELLWRWITTGLAKGTYRLSIETIVAGSGEKALTEEEVQLV